MPGAVVDILVAEAHGKAPVAHASARLDAGRGIFGDRFYDKDEDAQVTLVDADAIDAVNAAAGWSLKPDDMRRNIVTRGVDLNQLETSRFRIGDALLEGVELCEPCSVLGKLLADEEKTPPEVVKALVHKCGLRARVIESADIHAGDPIAPA